MGNRKRLLTSITCLLIAFSVNAQIYTNYYVDTNRQSVSLEEITVLKDGTFNTNFDSKNAIFNESIETYKYGIVIPIDIDFKTHGHWINKNKWRLLISSPDAKSIDILIKDLVLPNGVEINIFDVNRKMNFGL